MATLCTACNKRVYFVSKARPTTCPHCDVKGQLVRVEKDDLDIKEDIENKGLKAETKAREDLTRRYVTE